MNGLTPEQHRAIDLLVQGKTDEEAAGALSVTGDVVTRWRYKEPCFIAVLNHQRKTQWQGAWVPSDPIAAIAQGETPDAA